MVRKTVSKTVSVGSLVNVKNGTVSLYPMLVRHHPAAQSTKAGQYKHLEDRVRETLGSS
jgi:hypothetical protein